MTNAQLLKLFRITGWLEGASYLLLLFVGTPLKYFGDNSSIVKALGMPHGILFMAYVLLSHFVAEEFHWPIKKRFYALLASIAPFGTFIFERKYLTNPKK